MSKNLKTRVKEGLYQLILSICLLILIAIIRSYESDDILTLIRWVLIIIFLILAYNLYRWLTKDE
jgi:hypothetical protein